MKRIKRIKIIADTREKQKASSQYRFKGYDCQVIRKKLWPGDYSIQGFEHLFCIETKRRDLPGSLCGHGRVKFEKELAAMSKMKFKAVIIEHPRILPTKNKADKLPWDLYKYSGMKRSSFLGSVKAFTKRYGVPFIFCKDRKTAEAMTFKLLKLWKEKIENEKTSFF